MRTSRLGLWSLGSERSVRLTGIEAHADAGWSTGDEHARDALAEVIDPHRAEWEERFAALDACVEPVVSLSEALEEPVFLGRSAVVPVEAAPVVVPHEPRRHRHLTRGTEAGAHARSVKRGVERSRSSVDRGGSAASVD